MCLDRVYVRVYHAGQLNDEAKRFLIMITATQKLMTLSLLAALYSSGALAANNQPLLNKNLFSIGAGISLNDAGRRIDDEVGFQVFGGYDLTQLNLMEGVASSVEFGFMDYGFDGRDNNGLWTTFVIDGAINGNIGWLARIGLDLGDDSGLMLGGGIAVGLDAKTDLRFEYVVRDDIDSLQMNLRYHF